MINYLIKKNIKRLGQITVILITILGSNLTLAQAQGESASIHQARVIVPRQKVSPLAMATFWGTDSTYLKITYGQPFKKERDIFGGIVPFGEVWRTGANEATEITITKDVYFVNKLLKAGTYTLFTIPNKDTWTIILNDVLGQWGAYKYEDYQKQDVLEVDVPVKGSRNLYEAFTIEFIESRKGVDMYMIWDRTQIVVPIKFLKQ